MKARRHATSIALIVSAIVVAAYAWIYDRGRVTDAEREARATSVFPAFRRADVARIEIARAAMDGRAAETIVLEHDAAEDAASSPWRMTSPRRETANVAAVDALLQELESSTRVRKVDGPASGLDAPRVRVVVAMGKVSYAIALGAAAPRPEGAAYAQVEGEAPIVVRAELAHRLLASSDAYRERTIVPYAAADLARVDVRGASPISIRRAAYGDFVVDADGTRVSAAALEKLWSAMGEMRAERFLDDAEGDRLVANARVVVELVPREASKPRAEIAIGGACGEHDADVVVVRRSPSHLAACAPRGILDGLAPASLADTRLFAARPDEMIELRLESSPTKVLDLARSGSGWHQRAPIDRVLAQDEVDGANALVLALSRAEGVLLDRVEWQLKPRSGAPFTVDPTVTVVRAEHGEEKLEIRAREASGVVVHRLADDAWLRVPLATARLLEPRAVAVRGRDVWGAIGTPPIARVSTRCGVAQDVAHGDAGWTMTAPAGFAPDPAAVLDVANVVLRAKAESWIADADDGTFGFADAKCAVAITVAHDGGAARLGLVLGADAPGGVFAHVEGEPSVFVVAKPVADAARRLVIDRSAFAIDAATASVVVAKRGARAELRAGRVDGGAADGGAKLADAIASLRADAALHVGPSARDEGLATPVLELRVASGDAGTARRIAFGGETTVGNEKMRFARVDGVDATFVVPEALVDAILEAF